MSRYQGIVVRFPAPNSASSIRLKLSSECECVRQILDQAIASDGLFSPIKIPDSRSRATLIGVARISDRECYQLIIEDSSTQPIQLFFDVESGLLLRRVNVTNTMLGPLNVQWDFSDYRDVSGIKLPFLIRTSDVSSYDTVVRRFSEVKIDSSINENVFDIPRGPSGP